MKQLFEKIAFVFVGFMLISLLSSCSGSKVTEKDLEGSWVLKTINGVSVSEAFEGNKPNMEFNFEKNMVYGYAGCNRFSGPFTLQESVLKVENIASTQMLCMEANKEDEFLMALGTASGLTLAIENETLLFKDGDKTIFEFEKEIPSL